MQRPPPTPVHVHIAAGDERQLEAPASLGQMCQLFMLAAIRQQFDSYPETIAKGLTYPMILDIERKLLVRYPQHDAVRQIIIEMRDFLKAIETGQPVWPTFQDGCEVNRVMDAVLRSHRERAWVMVGNSTT